MTTLLAATRVPVSEIAGRVTMIEVEITGPTIDENLAAKVRSEVKKAGLRLAVNATKIKDAGLEVATMRCPRDVVAKLDPVFKMLSAEFGPEMSAGVKGITFVAVYERQTGLVIHPH